MVVEEVCMAARKKAKTRVVVQIIRKKVTLTEKSCPQCGTVFEGRWDKRFCSAVCRSKADYQKHANARREARVKRYRAQQKERPKR